MRDLEDIGDWIAQDDPNTADRFTAELGAKARQIAAMPHAFPLVPELARRGLRKRSYRHYMIFYRVTRTTVTIVRILRHSRDYSTLLRKK